MYMQLMWIVDASGHNIYVGVSKVPRIQLENLST
jgi:hypothetical protein